MERNIQKGNEAVFGPMDQRRVRRQSDESGKRKVQHLLDGKVGGARNRAEGNRNGI